MTIFGLNLIYLAIGLLGISIMVLVHELGHMFVARSCKINVEMLRFGFGPTIFKWEKNGTLYAIGIIPFGGLCKMSGQDDLLSAISQKKKHIDTFEEHSIWAVSPLKRILSYLAGPLANMIFAFICYALLLSTSTIVSYNPAKIVLASDYPILFTNASNASSKAGLVTGDVIIKINETVVSSYEEMQDLLALLKDTNEAVLFETERGLFSVYPENGLFGILPYKDTVVGSVVKDSPEDKAGLKRGDKILTINNKNVSNMMDLLEASHSSDKINMSVLRKNNTISLEFDNPTSSLNFTLSQQTKTLKGEKFFTSLLYSVKECFVSFKDSIEALVKVITGKADKGETLEGTFSASQNIGMLTTIGFYQSFNSGLRTVLYLLASVSISLAVANLMPIPALDGGLILISFAELITKRTFHPKMYLGMQIIGLVIITVAILLLTFA